MSQASSPEPSLPPRKRRGVRRKPGLSPKERILASKDSANARTHRTTSELCTYLGVSERQLRRWIASGAIPPPDKTTTDGWKLYSQAQSRAILAWHLERIKNGRIGKRPGRKRQDEAD